MYALLAPTKRRISSSSRRVSRASLMVLPTTRPTTSSRNPATGQKAALAKPAQEESRSTCKGLKLTFCTLGMARSRDTKAAVHFFWSSTGSRHWMRAVGGRGLLPFIHSRSTVFRKDSSSTPRA